MTEAEKEFEEFDKKLQEHRKALDKIHNQQGDENAGFSRQQKSAERYHAKKQMLSNKKDDCNRNIRDLGVLPEEAFEKYTNEKMDRVSPSLGLSDPQVLTAW